MFWCAFFVHTNDYFASQGEFWSVSYQKRQQFRLKDRYYCRMVAIPITTHVRQTITHNPLPIKELAAVVAGFLPVGLAMPVVPLPGELAVPSGAAPAVLPADVGGAVCGLAAGCPGHPERRRPAGGAGAARLSEGRALRPSCGGSGAASPLAAAATGCPGRAGAHRHLLSLPHPAPVLLFQRLVPGKAVPPAVAGLSRSLRPADPALRVPAS